MKKFVIIFLTAISSLFATDFVQQNGIDLTDSNDYDSTKNSAINSNSNSFFDKNDINSIDRAFLFGYDKDVSDLSDALLLYNIVSPAFFNMSGFERGWTIPGKYLGALLATGSLTYLVKYIVQRPRPYNYFEDTPKEQLEASDALLSFFSGHSSISFASAVFNAMIFQKYNNNSRYKPSVWIISMLSATATATLRVLAGKHFLSDVVVGAVVGSAISYIIVENMEVTKNNGNIGYPANINLIGISVGL